MLLCPISYPMIHPWSTWPGYLLGSTWPVQGFLACTHWMALCSAQISAVFCGVSQSGVPWLGAGDPTNPKKQGGTKGQKWDSEFVSVPFQLKLSFQLFSSNLVKKPSSGIVGFRCFWFCPDPWGEWSSFTHIFQPPTRFEQLHQPDQESLESSGSLSWSQLPLVGSVSLVCKWCVSTPKVGNKKSGRNRFIGNGTWS